MPGEFDMDAAVGAVADGLGFSPEGDGDDAAIVADSNPAGTAEPAPAPAPAALAVGSNTPAAPASEPAAAPAPDPLAEPPKTWRKEAAAVWAALPAEAKAEIAKREEDIFRGIESYRTDATFGKSVQTTLAPYMPVLKQYNIDPVEQISGLMKAHHTLALGTPEEKVQLFRQLVSDYGINLEQVAAEPAFVDPTVQHLQKELQGVKSTLSETQKREHDRQVAEYTQAVEKFASDPKNVHFEAVANDMVTLMQSKVCATLEQAYEKAVWTNPVTRAKEIERIQTEAQAKREAEAAERVKKARDASGANVRASVKSGSAAAPLGTIDDTLQETLAAIKARG